MKIVARIFLLFPFAALAQERMELEIIPVWVTDPLMQSVADLEELNDALSTVHKAMALLGVRPDEYNLTMSAHVERLECSEATTLVQQTCEHAQMGTVVPTFESWSDFTKNIYPTPVEGEYQLLVLILPDNWAWLGMSGLSWRWRYLPNLADAHWSNTSCRAWSVNELILMTHELGHCFRLGHNEDELDGEVDLMLTTPVYLDWLKPSNVAKVQYHFRDMPPAIQAITARPTVELMP